MANPNGIRAVILLAPPLFLLLPFSVLLFVLDRISDTVFDAGNFTGRGTYGSYNSPASTAVSDYGSLNFPVYINSGPTTGIIAIAIAAYIVSILGTCAIWELRRVEGTASHQRKWCWTTLLSNFAVFAASIAVLVYASVASNAPWKGYIHDRTSSERRTRETWACQISEHYDESWASGACVLTKTTRYMLIPVAVSAALTMFCTWVLVRDRGGAGWLIGGRGRYAGFESIYEPKRRAQQVPQQAMPPHQMPPPMPVPLAQIPQVQKGAPTANDQTLFR
ncbi:hypothetical protein BS50DRAFT_248277 [Corynespora cassiicola Philippines]|uniref:MARVEL domain-containing protein n=1 Tax=Corynespora cassiicola Philippines TaxID=1448308 RepID=A0A2T2P3N7_CORCC|nr:hypothetical protein BS50DRAFT_248277 [Corynespora cassiicola Philippines]